jgi:hypothetical protein
VITEITDEGLRKGLAKVGVNVTINCVNSTSHRCNNFPLAASILPREGHGAALDDAPEFHSELSPWHFATASSSATVDSFVAQVSCNCVKASICLVEYLSVMMLWQRLKNCT